LPNSRGLQDTSNCCTGKQQKTCTSGTESAPTAENPCKKAELTKTSQTRKKSAHEGRGANGKPALLAAALWHAGRGYPVFPLHWIDETGRCTCRAGAECGKAGKHPRIANGHKGATTDPGQIRRWWSRWPTANIGIPTGERSGLLVLDIDEHGFTSLEALEEEHGPLPETLTVRTGGGGMHVYLKYPPGEACEVRNSAGRVGAGLDVRGEGGYAVAPPSRTDKGPYAFLDRFPRADPPEWLLEAARGPDMAATDEAGPDTGGAGGLDAGELEPIPKGERGDTLFRIGCSLRARGCEYARILAELERINRARCSPPIGAHPDDTDARELEKIAESVVSRYPAGDAAPAPEPEALKNVEALFSGVLERLEWTGRGGPTDRAVYAALLITARRYGQPSRGGLKVYVSVRALALAAGTSKKTAGKALDRLRGRKLLHRASEGRGTKAGALILRVSEVTQEVDTQPQGGVSTDSGLLLRSYLRELLRLRWGPGRIGKLRALLLEVIAQTGETPLSVLSDRTGRRRYDVRRALVMAEARALVECSGDTYRLVPEFAAALDNELEASGIKLSERLDRQRYERQREAYREHIARRRLRIPDGRRPDGRISDLERVEPEKPEASPVPAVSSVSEVFAMARERFGLSGPAPSEAPPVPDKDSPAAFVLSELRGVTGMRYREMLRRWKELGGDSAALEEAISKGPYRFRREPLDFNQPYVYRSPASESRLQGSAA